LAAIGRMQNLGRADGRQVAIALVIDDDAAWQAPLDSGRDRRSASVRSLNAACTEVIVGEDGAAYRADQNGPVLDAELIDCLGDHLVHDSVPAARTEVRLVL